MKILRQQEKWFLGGTCNGTTWRDLLMPLLDEKGVKYFNPVVDNWTPDCIKKEDEEKNKICNVHLYVITPAMKGVYSIAEIIDSVYRACLGKGSVKKVIFVVSGDFKDDIRKSLEATIGLCNTIASEYRMTDYVVAKKVKSIEEIAEL